MLKKENRTWPPLGGDASAPRDQFGFDSSSADPSSLETPARQKSAAARPFPTRIEAVRWIGRCYEQKLRTITRRRALGYALVLLFVGAIAYLVVGQTSTRQGSGVGFGGRFGRDAPVPVLTATAKTADVPVYFDGVGTTRALNTVTVRPQVDGRLLRIN